MNQVIRSILSFSKQVEDADFLYNIIGKGYNEALTKRIPIVLFDACSVGGPLCSAMKIHGAQINCFCDNNPSTVGGHCGGYQVLSVEEVKKNYPESLVIISVSQPYAQQIQDQLLNIGFSEEKVRVPPIDPLLYYTNVRLNWWPVSDMQKFAQQLQDVYDLLSDEKSKDLFLHRIALFSGGFDYSSFKRFIQEFADLRVVPNDNLFSRPRYDENYFYFHSDFFPLKGQEVFANVGALLGDCAIEFVNTCEEKGLQYKEIINFEPDPNNFKQLLLNTNHLANVRCQPYGLWSHSSRLRFFNPDPSHAGTVGSLNNDGNLEVDVASLDELLPDAEITFIKMDVEGAEMKALIGAFKTICQNRPKLAISVYHKRDDIFKIPLLIHNMCPGYKFYLRHHSTTFSETVLFAVP